MDNGKDKRLTKKITVYGIVQGVGFRPLVYHIAQKLSLKGNVRNVGGLAEIMLQATERELDEFIKALMSNQTGGCEIVKFEIEDCAEEAFSDFKILQSETTDLISIIPPDLPVCPDCQRELYDKNDRRYQNPFISCMSCGPRYTIIEELPYDRDNTTMIDYMMCPSCHGEYVSPESRRFHAQTISCNDCGPYLIYRETAGMKPERYKQSGQGVHVNEFLYQEALDKAEEAIQGGGIIAVKGIGGYHLVCSPFDETAVMNLRKLKGREEKPFAVMFEDMKAIEDYCIVSEEERKLLETKARPIVLLYRKEADMIIQDSHGGNQEGREVIEGGKKQKMFAPSVNKGSIYCGAFLPYTPLQLLLTGKCGPLIMTSANISDQPIIREDEVMLSLNSSYLNGVLYNTRRIVRSVDDSVAKIIGNKRQLIRRSRGYVPYPVFLNNVRKDIQIFAAGGDLKAAYCLYKNGSAYVSQHFGDLEELTVLEEYTHSFADLSRLLMITPELAVCDYHPNYFSSRYVNTLGIPILKVQHHHAHAASVIAEHDLHGPVIGVAFDGTGYGTDGNIWGGEFLICEGAEFIRAAHLCYTPILGGDQSMRDAKKTASCFLIAAGMEEYVRDERQEMIKAAVTNKINTVLSSSMGRLFDAVSSILNINQENKYEGECAADLEREAVLAVRNIIRNRNALSAEAKSGLYCGEASDLPTGLNQEQEEFLSFLLGMDIAEYLPKTASGINEKDLSFDIKNKNGIILIDPKPVLKTICCLRGQANRGILALAFHFAAADMIESVCEILRLEQKINTVALCGGVFQNTILTERALRLLEKNGFNVYINEAVPPNDGSISLGQTYIGLMKQ